MQNLNSLWKENWKQINKQMHQHTFKTYNHNADMTSLLANESPVPGGRPVVGRELVGGLWLL